MTERSFVRRSPILLTLTATGLAACSDGTGPTRLTPQDVGAVYHVCALAFQPNQTLLPSIDIRAAVMDTSAQATAQPRLYVDNLAQEFELEYSTPGSTSRRRHAGSYQTGARSVLFSFTTPAPALTGLLLPGAVEMEFQPDPHRLDFAVQGHDVPRQEYAQMAGTSQDGLAEQIRGTISGQFRAGGCG